MRKVIIWILSMAMVLTSLTAFAADETLHLVGVLGEMPEITVVFSGNPEVNGTAKYGEKTLTISSVAPYDAEKHTTFVYLVADISSRINESDISQMKEIMIKLVNQLGERDAVRLVTFEGQECKTDVYSIEADREALLAKIDAITLNNANTPLEKALIDQINNAQQNIGKYDRQFAVVFSNFGDYEAEAGQEKFAEVFEKYRQTYLLPVYGIGMQVSSSIDGSGIRSTGGEFNEMSQLDADSFLQKINNVTIVKLHADNFTMDYEMHSLSIDGQDCGSFKLQKYRQDTEKPSFEAEFDNEAIRVTFTKRVLGAGEKENYALQAADGTSIAAKEANYIDATCEAHVSFDVKQSGTYTLSISNVTDDTPDKNPLEESSQSIKITLPEVEVDETEEQPKEQSSLWILIASIAAIVVIVVVSVIAIVAVSKKRREQNEIAAAAAAQELQILQANANHSSVVRHIQNPVNAYVYLAVRTGRNETLKIKQEIASSVIFGRSAKNCDVCIDDAKLSRQHFALEYQNGKLVASDLNSTNGTMLNGTRMTSPRPIQAGDIIFVGLTEIKVLKIEV